MADPDPTKPMLWPYLQRSSRDRAMPETAPGSVAAPVPQKTGGLKDEEREQIRADLTAAKYDPDVIEQTIADLDAQAGAPGLPGEAETTHPGSVAVKTLVPMLLAGVGGSVGRKFLGNVLTRPIAAGTGEAAGAGAGMFMTGTPLKESVKGGALTGLLGGGAEAALNVGTRTAGAVAGVPEPAIEKTLGLPGARIDLRSGAARRFDLPVARVTQFPKSLRGAPPPGAEDAIAGRLSQQVRDELTGKVPIPGTAEVEQALRTARPPGLKAGMRTQEISTAPIRRKIGSMMRKPMAGAKALPSAVEESANEGLQRALAGLPQKFRNLGEMQDYLRRIRQPVKGQFGKPVASLAKEDLKDLQAAVRQYRDDLLGGPESKGAQAYEKVSSRLGALGKVKSKIMEPSGEQKIGAQDVITKAMHNQELMRRIRRINPKVAQEIEDLALQRDWSKPATGWHRIGVLARPIARTSAVLARPAGQGTAMLTTLLQAMHAQQPQPAQ